MITSLSNAKVKQVVLWQSKSKERKKEQVFLIEGIKLFEEVPVAWIREAYLTADAVKRLEEKSALKEKLSQIPWEEVSDEVMQKMSDTQTPQGILTVVRCPEYSAEELLKKPDGLYLVLEDIQDPGNLGTMMRTGEGAGITAVIMNKTTVDIFNPKTIRATMGSIFRVPFVIVDDLETFLPEMKKNNIRIFAAHLNGKNYYAGTSFQGKTAFLIGNEGNGLSKEITELSDERIKIPMEGKLESLNAGVAGALLLYEAKRQRSIW